MVVDATKLRRGIRRLGAPPTNSTLNYPSAQCTQRRRLTQVNCPGLPPKAHHPPNHHLALPQY